MLILVDNIATTCLATTCLATTRLATTRQTTTCLATPVHTQEARTVTTGTSIGIGPLALALSPSSRLADALQRGLAAAGLTDTLAVYKPSDDMMLDDEIQIHRAGVALPLAVQVGCGYYCVNRCLYVDGELDGADHLYTGRNFAMAVATAVAAAVTAVGEAEPTATPG